MTRQRGAEEPQPVRKWNDVFTAISAEPRRQLVASLLDQPSAQSVSLPDGATPAMSSGDRDTLRRELHHCHLPLLADMGFIQWDTDPLVASRGPRFEDVAVVYKSLRANATSIPESLLEGSHWLE